MGKRFRILCSLAGLILVVFFVSSAFAWDDRWEIKTDPYNQRSNFYNRSNSYNTRQDTDIEMRRKYDYNPANKYRGTIGNDGYTRMRDLNGNTLRGYIEEDGYGKLRDLDGNTYRVKPKW